MEEEGDVDGVLEVRRVVAVSLSALERVMADSLMGRALSGLSLKHMFEQILGISSVMSERRTESPSWTSTSPKLGRKRSKEINTDSSCS